MSARLWGLWALIYEKIRVNLRFSKKFYMMAFLKYQQMWLMKNYSIRNGRVLNS